jgi:hypothetical protein
VGALVVVSWNYNTFTVYFKRMDYVRLWMSTTLQLDGKLWHLSCLFIQIHYENLISVDFNVLYPKGDGGLES